MKYVKRDIINLVAKKYNLSSLDICDSAENLVLNILGYILNQDVLKLKAENYIELSRENMSMLENYMEQIAVEKIPPQYIIGNVPLYNESYIVTPDVLIPRQDTETLIEQVIMAINSNGYKNMLDLCTGTGAIGISVALNSNIEIWSCKNILIIGSLKNVILTIIIYPIIQLTGYDIEEEYKGSKILTKYF